jgi:uncharacterized membrane protein
VVVSLFAFLSSRNYAFVWITLLVLLATGASIVFGFLGFAR